MTFAMFLATTLVLQNDDVEKQAKSVIERLRSDRIEEREEAHRELRRMGKDVLPLLRKLGQDRDLEFASRIQAAIRALDLRETLKAEARDSGTVKATTVVEWMSAESGRRIIAGEDLGLAHRKIRISTDGLDSGSAYELGVDLLKAVDVATLSDPDDPKRVTLAPAPIASKRDLRTYTSLDALPKANEFCTLVVTVKHASPRDLQAALIMMMSFPQNCLSVEGAGKLILSDYASNLRKLGKLVEQLDVAIPAQSSRVSVTLLSAAVDNTPSVPEAFQTLRLPEITKKNKFSVLAEGFARLEHLAPQGGVRRQPSAASIRVEGYVVDLESAMPHPAGLQLDRIALRSDAEADRKASPLFQTRLVLKKGEWTVAGSAANLVLLVRAEAE